MGWWKADPVPEPAQPIPASTIPPHPIPSQPSSDPASACPVDPKTRAIWLQQANKKAETKTETQLPPSHPPLPTPKTQPQKSPPIPTFGNSSPQCSSDEISQTTTPAPSEYQTPSLLSHDRVVSSIPRALPSTVSDTPMNSEAETGASKTGNWIYPSESQFFHAVMRKQTASSPEDLVSSISHIIPIHNAVNERAWTLIKAWEGDSSARCGGPKLLSFQGLGSGALSPKARLNSLMGYREPFDRHDWVVERCGGEKVEYVIDFYQGKADPAASKSNQNNLNFYLDVRPKLNSVEGWKMRAERFVGWR